MQADCHIFRAAKYSRPSRAYLHLTLPEYLELLSEKVRKTSFIDAKGSTKDAALLGPPCVEFAPYGRVPSSKPRKDTRQGTIDLDPDFIGFLESLTNPVLKQPPPDQEIEVLKGKGKVSVTPLIQFLKEKKASKGKENASLPKSKQVRQEAKEGKPTTNTDNKAPAAAAPVNSPKRRSAQAAKVEQAARDTVKVLNKQAAGAKAVSSPAPPTAASRPPTVTPVIASNSTANAALADKKRERGNISAAAKILQRDLGLAGNASGRGGRRGMPNPGPRPAATVAQTTTKQAPATSPASNSAPPAVTLPPTQPPKGPAASRPTGKPLANNATGQAAAAKPTPVPSTATQAFLKHANPSQGVTEPLLEEAFIIFGAVNKVEIDPRKGFAYVDFVDPESLQKAITASPIKVAQGNVQVLERKSGTTLQARNARVGSPMMANRGGTPMGPRGANTRGRGGMGRGGMGRGNMSHINVPKAPSTGPGSVTASNAAPAGPTTTPET